MEVRRVPILSRALFIALLLGGPVRLAAQPEAVPSVHFERIGSQEGLSHNTVRAILQDSQGFLWIGTADGLNRYDGYDFVVYRHVAEDATSLSNNHVRALFEDRDGRLWIATQGGLNAFDPAAGRFTRHPLGAHGNDLDISAMLEDAEGALWVGTSAGLFRYAPASKHLRAFEAAPAPQQDGEAGTYVYTMDLDARGTLWVSASQYSHPGALYRYRAEADTFERLAAPAGWGDLGTLHVGPADSLWLGTTQAVGVFDPGTQRFHRRVSVGSTLLYEDHQRVLWIGTENGLYRYAPPTGRPSHHLLDPTGSNALSNAVQVIVEDRAGSLWVGTLSGLYRFTPHRKSFSHLRHVPDAPNSLSSNTVMAVHEDASGLLWVGTLGGGLNRVDRTTGSVTRYQHRPGDPGSLAHDNVWAIHEDRRGRLWVGTDAGLCRLDRRADRFDCRVLVAADAPYVNVLAEDASGRLWAGGDRLYRFDPDNPAAVERFVFSTPGSNDLIANIQALYVAAPDTVWIGTEFQGFFRLIPSTGRVTDYWQEVWIRDILRGKAVRVIYASAGGILWLGTDLGLVRFDPRTTSFRPYLQQDGLPGSEAYAVLEDAAGHLWVSTNQGLARLDPHAETLRTFTSAHGTGNTEYNRRAAFRSPDGAFFFGGLNGVTAFVPEHLQDNPYVPPVVITKVEKANQEGAVSLNPIQAVRKGLVLDPGDYSFAFEFAALNFLVPEQNQYAYQLEGIDEGWVAAGTRRFVSYTGLSPGRYVFRVKGSNNDGVWNDEGVAVAVTVRPWFWQTAWFRVVIVLAIAGVLAALYRYRVAQLLTMERMRVRIASDLHDDIGSRLSGIALMSDVMQATPPDEPLRQAQLAKISTTARQLVDGLRDIVWFITPDHDKPGEMVLKMKAVAATLLNGAAYTFRCPTPALLEEADMAFRRNVYLIYKEALHNVARHAGARTVAIEITERQGTLTLTIADDGTGFDPAQPHDGHGLSSMRHRADQIGARLDVESAPGAGTRLTLSAKITRLRNGMGSGAARS